MYDKEKTSPETIESFDNRLENNLILIIFAKASRVPFEGANRANRCHGGQEDADCSTSK